LERVLTDFGADRSFAKAVEKVSEHYGLQVSISAVRGATQKHGWQMQTDSEVDVRMPEQGVAGLMAGIDGAFVPIVEMRPGEGDKRKSRACKYTDARLCLAGPAGSVARR
jgi:hypothetical protein